MQHFEIRKLHLAEDFEMLRLTPDFVMLRLMCDFKTLLLTDFKIMRWMLFSVTMGQTCSTSLAMYFRYFRIYWLAGLNVHQERRWQTGSRGHEC